MREVKRCQVKWRIDEDTKAYVEGIAKRMVNTKATGAAPGDALCLIVRGFRAASNDPRCRERMQALLSGSEGEEALTEEEAVEHGMSIVRHPRKTGRIKMQLPDGNYYDPD